MFAKPQSTFIVLVTLCGLSVGEVPTASAQGILQRLGTRIRSRITTPPAPPNLNANPNTNQNQNDGASRYNPYPNPGQPTPLDSDSPAVRPLSADPDATISPNRKLPDDLGNSILAPNDNPDAFSETAEARRLDARSPDSQQRRGRATIGIRVLNPRPGMPAVQVVSFHDESRADEAGIQRGDAILAIDGVPTPTIAAIAAELVDRNPGELVRVQVGRGDQVMLVPVPLVLAESQRASRVNEPGTNEPGPDSVSWSTESIDDLATESSPPQRPALGIQVEEPNGNRGALVVTVDPNSPAAISGLKVGDRIVAVDHRFIVDTTRLLEALERRRTPLAPMPVKLVRDEELVDLTIDFADRPPVETPGEATQTDPAPIETAQPSGSVLEGLGSKLGSWLGSGSKAATSPADIELPAGSPNLGSFDVDLDGFDVGTPSGLPAPMPLIEPGPAFMKPETLPPSQSGLPAPMPFVEPGSALVKPETLPPSQADLLDFGDGEPIDQAVFENAAPADRSSVMDLPANNSTAATDPPSLSKAKPESAQNELPQNDVLKELRAEIEKLQARLELLEKTNKE